MQEVISVLESVRRGMEDNIYDYTVDGKCCGCGNCCSNLLPMNDKEIREIRQYIRKHHIEACKHLLPVVDEPLDMVCPFLDTDKKKDKCRIYPVRPFICRKFLCDSEQMAKVTRAKVKQTRRIVMVREEFFGDR